MKTLPHQTLVRRILIAIGTLTCVATMFGLPSSARRERLNESTATIKALPTAAVKASKSDGSFLKLSDGLNQTTTYTGSAEVIAALQSNNAKPLALASADFDHDGFADLVTAYAGVDKSFLTLQNADSAAFTTSNSQDKLATTFRSQATVTELSIVPDFVDAGDFTRDGCADIVVASRGDRTLLLVVGDGHGGFSSRKRLNLPGLVTALATGDVNRSGDSNDLIVGVAGTDGPKLLVFESNSSLLVAQPTVHSVNADVRSLVIGQLDNDNFGDVAFVAGNQVNILHGTSERREDDVVRPVINAGQLEVLTLPISATAITLGDFVWDRESRTEIAVSSNDGGVEIIARGSLDTHQYDVGEIQRARLVLAEVRDGKRPMSDYLALGRGLSNRSEPWTVVKKIDAASNATLLTARLSARPSDDLLVVNNDSREIQVLNGVRPRSNEIRAHHASTIKAADKLLNLTLAATEDAVAVMPMRVSADGRQGLVILNKSSVLPTVLAPMAMAAFVVTKNADTNDGACNADCSLREAIVAANAAPGSTITFAAGVNPTLTRTGSDNTAVNGDLDINASVTITGNTGAGGVPATTISTTYVSGCGDCKVFGVNQSGAFTGLTVSFNNLIIQNGFNTHVATGSFQETGGGIDFFLTGTGNSYSMTNCVVTQIQSYGGGINIDSGLPSLTNHGSVTFTTTTISNNTADATGGGLNLFSDIHSVSFSGCTISGNTTLATGGLGAQGGGIKIRHTNGGTVSIQSSTISNNTATGSGGGIDYVTGNTGITFTMSDTAVTGNTSQSAGTSSSAGGGLSLSGNLTMTNVDVTLNHSDQAAGGGRAGGGGILMGGGIVTMDSASTISNNTANGASNAGKGGGVMINGGTFTLTGVTISGNATSGDGGGILLDSTGSATLTMTNGSITGNSARQGGGLSTDSGSTGTASLTGVTITNNTATTDTGGILQIGSGTSAITINGIAFTGNTSPTLRTTSGTLTLQNTVSVDNSVTVAGGTLAVGTSTLTIPQNLTLSSGSVTNGASSVSIGGNFTFSGGAFTAGTSTYTFNGSGPQAMSGSPAFNNLVVNKGGGTLTLGNNITEAGNLTLTNGIFDLSSFSANRSGAPGGTLTVSNGTTLKIGGTNTLPSNFTTHVIGATSTIEYSGTNQSVATLNSSQKYGNLVTSGSGIKTLAGNLTLPSGIATSLTIGSGTTLDVSASNFAISFTGATWSNSGTFTPRSGTVTFDPTSGTQTLVGNTSFFNLTLQNTGATTNLGSGTNTIGGTLSKTAGTMVGGSGTTSFTGNPGAISGAGAKEFNNLTISAGGNVTATGGNITLLNDFTNNGTYNQSTGNLTFQNNFTNNGTFTQTSGSTSTFATGGDGNHSLAGSGTTTTFGVFAINTANTLDAGSLNFNVIGATFTVDGTFTGNASTVTFNGAAAQALSGNGAKTFAGLTINNANGVTLNNGTAAVDASVSGVLTLTTDFTVSSTGPAILQQSGTSAGAADVIGTVRRTDLGVTERSFGNVNNSITVGTGTAPTQMDFNLAKNNPAGPPAFPASVKVVPRDITLTPTGGAGFTATLKLRYLDSELVGPGITESRLVEWKNVGGTTWTAQGGAVDTTNNFVSLPGVTSFSEWALAEGSDLTLSKANNVSNAAVTGQAWNWTLTASNGGAPATFTAGQTILQDNLPNSNVIYGTPTVQNVSNITGSANISCSITSNDLTCTANGGSVTFDSNLGVSKFDVVFSATPQTVGSYQNPRTGGGTALIDPNNNVVESGEANNAATANTVTVSKANTTTTITNSVALGTATVVGQPYAVTWSVTVNSPGTVGTPLTGNVTVSDGSQTCFADVLVGTCNLTSTTPGAPKTITATYAGDTNYNASPASAGVPHTVNKANTTVTITEDNPDPSTTVQSVTVKWTVTVDSPGAGIPTGNVNVTVSGGAENCTAAVGAGQCSLTLTTTGTRTITATYVGDTNFNGNNDTESHEVISTTVSVNDAKAAEPTSGTTNMVFTVALSAPAPGAASINFTTADQAPGAGHAVAGTCGAGGDYTTTSGTINFATGEQVKSINVPICSDADNAEPDETFLVNLSTPVNLGINDGSATGTITAGNVAGTFLISELRTSGPGGPADDFVELYNNSGADLTVTASDASAGYGVYKMGADCNATPVLLWTIPNGTVITARGHYLITGTQYSLVNYGGTNAALGNNGAPIADIENDRNLAVFSTANILNISSVNRLDAVGFGLNTGGVCDLMREGTTAPPVSGTTVEYSFFRTEFKASSGNPQDTNNNAADFKFADTQGTFISGVTQALGAPGPENLASPLRRDLSGIGVLLFDTTASPSNPPNRFRDFTSNPAQNSTFGTLTIRRRVPNTTGGNVTRLRFRIVDMTTFPSPGGGVADLRALTSVDEVTVGPVNDPATCLAGTGSATTPCTVPTKGLTLEQPPNQTNGGGYNSTLSAGTVTLGNPLANNSSILVNFKLGIQTTGTFRFLIIVEALP
jgi:CSLREA domain-containing protein